MLWIMNMATWLESEPSDSPSPIQGSDGLAVEASWWVPDMFSAPPTRIMPRSEPPPAPITYQPAAPPAPALSHYALSFRARLQPEHCREAMRRMRGLRPRRALVCAIDGNGGLILRAVAGGSKAAEPPDASTSLMLTQVMETDMPVMRYEKNWTVCAPLRDRRDRVVGVILVEGTAARVDPEALGKLVGWARNQPEPAAPTPARRRRPGGCRPLPTQELANLLRSLSTMCSSGLTLNRALSQLSGSMAHPGVAELCECLNLDISQGCSFSRAAARHPRVFSAVQLGLLRVGENTGRLDKILGRLADYEEKKNASLLKLRRALSYPAVLLVICLLAGVLAPPFLLEGHFQLIRELGVQAPLLTRLLMGYSAFMRTPWPYLFLGGLMPTLYFAARRWLSLSENQLWLTRKLLPVPKLGLLLRTILQTRFARALALQVEAGGNLLNAVQLAGQACANPLMNEYAMQIGQSIYKGKGLARSLGATEFFTPMFLAVMQTAEEVGEIDKLTHWLAELGDQEMERNLDTLSSLLEPLVMVVMGGMVGFMIIATMLPLSTALQAF